MKLKILAILAILPLAASATTIAPPEYWEGWEFEHEEERPTRFEFHVVPMPAMPGDAGLPEYVPKIQDFVPCGWFVPIIPIQQEGNITSYRSGTPQCIPYINSNRDW